MKKYLYRLDIMFLIKISSIQFNLSVRKLGIVAGEDDNKVPVYSIQNMIDIFNFIYVKPKKKFLEIEFDSKINYKEIRL